MASDISTKDLAACKIVSIRKEVPKSQVGSFLSASAISLLVYLKEQKVDLVGRGFTIYHKATDDTVDIEVCLPVASSVAGRGEIHFRELPGAKASCIFVKGGYEHLKPNHEKLKQHCGSFTQYREVYLKGPQDTSNADDYETEIQYVTA